MHARYDVSCLHLDLQPATGSSTHPQALVWRLAQSCLSASATTQSRFQPLREVNWRRLRWMTLAVTVKSFCGCLQMLKAHAADGNDRVYLIEEGLKLLSEVSSITSAHQELSIRRTLGNFVDICMTSTFPISLVPAFTRSQHGNSEHVTNLVAMLQRCSVCQALPDHAKSLAEGLRRLLPLPKIIALQTTDAGKRGPHTLRFCCT